MQLRQITLTDFGGVARYEARLSAGLNVVQTREVSEISAAIGFLCRNAGYPIPSGWIRENTRISAQVEMDGATYNILAAARQNNLTLSAVDADGLDATDRYCYALTHCPEQDAVESFDGQDKTVPLRLCWYHNCEESPVDLHDSTRRLVNMKTFRSHLIHYIKAFQHEPINNKKNYQTAISPRGAFAVFHPDTQDTVSLSETEEKLFRYICFLNISEFWQDIEKTRDLHHEKKPLIIQNFLEFLDETADIRGLIKRTLQLQRQVILLSPSLAEEKKKWIGEYNERH